MSSTEQPPVRTYLLDGSIVKGLFELATYCPTTKAQDALLTEYPALSVIEVAQIDQQLGEYSDSLRRYSKKSVRSTSRKALTRIAKRALKQEEADIVTAESIQSHLKNTGLLGRLAARSVGVEIHQAKDAIISGIISAVAPANLDEPRQI